MGWLFGWPSRRSLIDELSKPAGDDHQKDGTIKRFILLAKLQRDRSGLWGYKLMDESAGPYTYSCPISFLEMVPPVEGDATVDGPAKYSHEWRTLVRAYWKQHREFRRLNRG